MKLNDDHSKIIFKNREYHTYNFRVMTLNILAFSISRHHERGLKQESYDGMCLVCSMVICNLTAFENLFLKLV